MEEEEGDDPFREAARFVAPCLAHFCFKPTHVIGTEIANGQLPNMNRETKLRIIQYERQENMQRATTVFFDWLLESLPSEPDAFRPFLQALLSDTEEHQHVHNVLCVSSQYVPAHRSFVKALTHRLAQGTVQLPILLALLTALRLLHPERAPHILNIATPVASEQTCARAVTFLMTSLYARQAEILHEMCGTTSAAGSTALAPQHAVPGNGSDVIAHADAADVIADVMRASSRESNPETEPSDIVDLPSPSVNSDHDRWRPEELEGQVREADRWPELLTLALTHASKTEREWPYALCPQDVPCLWEAAGGLVHSGLKGIKRQGREMTNDAASTSQSSESDATIRANVNNNNNNDNSNVNINWRIEHLTLDGKKWKGEYGKDLPIMNIDGDPADDACSLSSLETNSRQRGRRAGEGGGGGGGGVLREEETRRLRSGPIQLRPYQDELLQAPRQGHNALLWLPTGTGKTYIVLKYAEEHLKGAPERRVAFVVPKVRLARQQYERFLAYMPKFKPHLKCGETTTTAGGKQPLGEVLKTSRVVVVTGQSLVEAVERGRVSLETFSLLVLDECHHTRGGHPLRVLMNQYMELKFERGTSPRPQVLGLTASPGVGKARGKEVDDAARYLKQLCARLDVSHICSVRQNIQDFKQYVHQPLTEVKECEKREVDRLKERVETLMKEIEDKMLVDCEFETYLYHLSDKDSTKEKSLLKELKAPDDHRGEDQYTQWLANIERTLKQVNNPQAFYALNAHIDILKLCQRCLILNDDCDSLGALELLRDQMDALRDEKPPSDDNHPRPVDQDLFNCVDTFTSDDLTSNLPSLWEECSRRDCHNPKLKHLEDLLLSSSKDDPHATARKVLVHTEGGCDDSSAQTLVKQFAQAGQALPDLAEVEDLSGPSPREEEEEDGEASIADSLELSTASSLTGSEQDHLENVRGMIFVRTLDLSKALLKWMRRHPKLKGLYPDRITGVNASVKNGGMTKKEVTEVMSQFNKGSIRVVICTSAAEEGLDFKACNFVVRYLYEASMVSMVQIRGRARDENSRYSVLGRPNTSEKERDNVASEMAMQEAILQIQQTVDQDPKAHHDTIQKMQKEAWNNRWKKDVDERKRLQQRLQPGMYRLLCRKCTLPACTSHDIRLLRKTNRTVIGAEFSNKYKRKNDDQDSQEKAFDKKIPRTGRMHCRNCGFYWGIIVRSLDDGVEFPIIPLKNFLVEDEAGERTSIDKWSKAFEVAPLSEEDLLRHSEPLLGAQDRLEGDLEPEETEDDQEVERAGDEALLDPWNPPEGEGDDEAPEEDQAENLSRGRGARPAGPDASPGEVVPEEDQENLSRQRHPSPHEPDPSPRGVVLEEDWAENLSRRRGARPEGPDASPGEAGPEEAEEDQERNVPESTNNLSGSPPSPSQLELPAALPQ